VINSDDNTYRAQALDALFAARRELRRDKCRLLLKDALATCDKWIKTDPHKPPMLLKAQILKELALEENQATERTNAWGNAIRVLKPFYQQNDADLADAYATLVVDAAQDGLNLLESGQRHALLVNSLQWLNRTIKASTNVESKSELLARKSSVLRHLAHYEVGDAAIRARCSESYRCAVLAVETFRAPAQVLELALSEWKLGSYEKTDEKYIERMNRTDELFRDPVLNDFAPALFALPSFYRLTFRPLEACNSFPISTTDVRRLLRASYLYAEAATQLWFKNFPSEIVNGHLERANSLLETALAAGYANARILVDLAFTHAALNGVDAGTTVLNDLAKGGRVSWSKALELIATIQETNELVKAFALGIDDSRVITQLGTFAKRFGQNADLAEALYRVAIRLRGTDAIALTNLARLLVERGSTFDLQEASRLVQKAAQFSDRRFSWWRTVKDDLERKLELDVARKPSPGRTISHNKEPYKDKSSIRKEFQKLDQPLVDSDAKAARGYELENLLYQMARLTFPMAVGSYQFVVIESMKRQTDGYFRHAGEKYRVECKWKDQPIKADAIDKFFMSLDVAGISGLFVSMSGFEAAAETSARFRGKERPILLMDGNEVRALMSLQIGFDDIIDQKRAHFDQRSDPYYRVVPSSAAVG
jgi:Restriction endonuclease